MRGSLMLSCTVTANRGGGGGRGVPAALPFPLGLLLLPGLGLVRQVLARVMVGFQRRYMSGWLAR
ncbi:MAG: hypothetical protein R3D55_00735 [Chloroflexota bacterium]